MKTLHPADKTIVIKFIDYTRLRRKENIMLEIDARAVADHLKIETDVKNYKIANRFAELLEQGVIA